MIVEWLPRLSIYDGQNSMLYSLPSLPQNTYIFIDILNKIHVTGNHICHPSSQHNHPDKLLISTIVLQILWTNHSIKTQKVRAHIRISSNEITNQLANEGTTRNKPIPTPHIHIVHTIPYWLNGIPTSAQHEEIQNLQIYINKYHNKQELQITKSKYSYIDLVLVRI
jgi:hypothetical protein